MNNHYLYAAVYLLGGGIALAWYYRYFLPLLLKLSLLAVVTWAVAGIVVNG